MCRLDRAMIKDAILALILFVVLFTASRFFESITPETWGVIQQNIDHNNGKR